MKVMSYKGLLSELHRTTFWQPDSSRTSIEHLVEYLLTGTLAVNAPINIKDLAEEVLQFDLQDIRLVVLGGGTGLSTIVGGNSQMPDWPDQACAGLKQDFPKLISIVVTTDDGGSTGRLLKSLPLIGVGDLRKLLLSSIQLRNLQHKYDLVELKAYTLIRLIHGVFNHRFSEEATDFEPLRDPLGTIPRELRLACPKALADSLCSLGTYISPGGSGPTISPAGHSLGNLMLTSAIFMAAQGQIQPSPGLREIQRGINHIAGLIGAPGDQIHAATATPGQLKFRYANGVEVYGQSKSAWAHRDSPVERVVAEFTRKPTVSASVRQALADADLIVYAPGSLYTSIIPILQLEPISAAIRSNRRALKVLGANSWIQEGETDISLRNQYRGFLVSELIEAYDRNIPNGINDLFDVILSTNLEHIPGSILRNYALEGKAPIHLDRSRVESMGFHPIEATLLSPESQRKTQVIHHDARRFALAIRTLLYVDRFLKNKGDYALRRSVSGAASHGRSRKGKQSGAGKPKRSPLLCDYYQSMKKALSDKEFRPDILREFLLKLAWENRDIQSSHLRFFRGVTVIPAGKWNRSTEWDNILGYFDPQDGYLKLNKILLADPPRLAENLLVALGESLLGDYIEKRRWLEQRGSRCYEITLKPAPKRHCFLTNAQLRAYLQLARMTPDPVNGRVHRITINRDGGFLPPGLLFGLLYAWYLSGRGLTMEYEMTLLHWPMKSLIPLHSRDRVRKEALVRFFRTQVFGHEGIDMPIA
jgi:uncharacterized cofD-like protein